MTINQETFDATCSLLGQCYELIEEGIYLTLEEREAALRMFEQADQLLSFLKGGPETLQRKQELAVAVQATFQLMDTSIWSRTPEIKKAKASTSSLGPQREANRAFWQSKAIG